MTPPAALAVRAAAQATATTREELAFQDKVMMAEALLATVTVAAAAERARLARTTPGRVRLQEIKGMVPSLYNLPKGCIFEPRCPLATDQCGHEYPPLEEKGPGHQVACWHTDRLLGAG